MNTPNTRPNVLVEALTKATSDYVTALDSMARLIDDDQEFSPHYNSLKEAIELVRCLRRIVGDCSVQQIHAAFGAPGDFGYETTIGAALYRLYMAPAVAPTESTGRTDAAATMLEAARIAGLAARAYADTDLESPEAPCALHAAVDADQALRLAARRYVDPEAESVYGRLPSAAAHAPDHAPYPPDHYNGY